MKEENKKILITDDSFFMQEMLKDVIRERKKNYKLIIANNGEKAYKKFVEEKPDLVLLDIVMPEGEDEGIHVLEKIMRADSKAQVIMVSALGQKLIKDKCQKLGAKEYIVKPFDEEQIVNVVEQYLD